MRDMFSIARQKLAQRLESRVREINGPQKNQDLREIEQAFQYGEDSVLELFDKILHCGYSLFFVRNSFYNTALLLGEETVPVLTEDHLRAFAATPGGAGLRDRNLADILQVIMDHPDQSSMIASILRERRITDPDRIKEILSEQGENASAFSSGVL
jgi:hypothetical protein